MLISTQCTQQATLAQCFLRKKYWVHFTMMTIMCLISSLRVMDVLQKREQMGLSMIGWFTLVLTKMIES